MWSCTRATKVVACGEKVVAFRQFREEVRARHRKIAAIDMESYGVARAAELPKRRYWVIKGVCDLADVKKDDAAHPTAAANAAEVLSAMISGGAFATS
jgi:nucleoside phosphorylase